MGAFDIVIRPLIVVDQVAVGSIAAILPRRM
jgi:hypothetical protein